MNHEPIRDFNLVEPPQRSRRPVVALLLAIVACVLFADVASAQERYAPSTRSSRAAVEELAYRHFPAQSVPWVMRTAGCESGFDLYAENPKGGPGYDRHWRVYYWFKGPMQVDAVTWGATAAELGYDLDTPDGSMAMAARILEWQGVGAWPVCGRGAGW